MYVIEPTFQTVHQSDLILLYGVSKELHPDQTETVNNVFRLNSAKHVWDCLYWMQVMELIS